MKPESEAALADTIAAATTPFHIRGGGTRSAAPTGPGAVLQTSGLTGITLYEPGALTLVVKAGTPVAEIETALAAEGQRLAFEPMDHRGLLQTEGEPTIGGVVGANVSGPRRVQAGACRDFMLGVRFVDGAGQIVKNGGRVMKNVTGYDLVKLLTGSWGTLGVLTEVSLKVLPRPETSATVTLEGLSDADALAAMSKAMGSPFEITGAAHLPGDPARTLLRIEGFEASVAYRAQQIQTLFPDRACVVDYDPQSVAQTWAGVRDVAPLQGLAGDVWKISCKPSQAPALVAALSPERHLFDWAGGLIWALLPPGTDARAKLGAFDGHASLIRAQGGGQSHLPMFQPQSPALARFSEGIRAKFDPRGLFNPGLMPA